MCAAVPGLAGVRAVGRGIFLGENLRKLTQTLKVLNKYIYLWRFSEGGAGFSGVFLGGKFNKLAETFNLLPLLPCYFAVVARMGAGWYFYTFVPFMPYLQALFASGLRVGASSPARCAAIVPGVPGWS